MAFRPGKIVKRLDIGGRKVVFRYPRWEDFDDLLRHINGLVEERALIGAQKRKTENDEKEWLTEVFKRMNNGTKICLVAVVDGKLAGEGGVTRSGLDANSHVGSVGIGLGKGYRGIGIGSELMKALIEEAKRVLGLKVLTISYYEHNEAAKRAYEKAGFRETGRIPNGCNYYGKFYDEVIMAMQL